jgi:2,3-bisphosphoglycerate-independent phosphoglycerate mutase
MKGPLCLVVLDGFGIGDGGPADATARGHTPFLARARRELPSARVATSGEAVGLPPGQMGNSEVGHMTLGAGRVIDQDITRISKALAGGGLAANPALRAAFDAARRPGAALHLLGLVSDGGVHSHLDHLEAILLQCGREGVRPWLHAFLDGRDTPPDSGLSFLERVLPALRKAGGAVATVCGRYYAMDRDQRWERIQLAYDAIVERRGVEAPDPLEAVRAAYARGETDEFVRPTVVAGGRALREGDAVLFFNFRADRARELTNALTAVAPAHLPATLRRRADVRPSVFVCLTEYDADFGLPVAFAPRAPRRILGEVLSERGLRQLRAAETEKYAHVTFFFNCGREEPFPGEDRILVPSPRDVPTYDHKPEMSAPTLTGEILSRLRDDDYDFVLVNYANPDMVGHTGSLPAATKAVETIDACLERLSAALLAAGGEALVTADHGNCELMIDPETGGPHTAHTTNPVPIWWVTHDPRGRRLRDGTLADVAPTLLDLLGLPAPAEMTGRSLLV